MQKKKEKRPQGKPLAAVRLQDQVHSIRDSTSSDMTEENTS
jgi:hypothetical protein